MLPNVSGAVMAYMQELTFDLVKKRLVDGILQETRTTIETLGVRQVVDPQKLNIKEEGQRSWRYEDLHIPADEDIDINIDDIVIFKNNQYRVIEKYDYSEYGYIEYMIAQTFKGDNEESS